jgi:hypothetical protein
MEVCFSDFGFAMSAFTAPGYLSLISLRYQNLRKPHQETTILSNCKLTSAFGYTSLGFAGTMLIDYSLPIIPIACRE